MADKKKDREKTWEKVQLKAFTAWVNSYLNRRGKKVVVLETDMCDGILLCDFLEIVTGSKYRNVQRGTDILRVHKIQNVNIALSHIQGDLGVKLVSVGAEDIVDGNVKLLLGMLWSLFRRLRIQTINEEDKSSEEGLLAWVKKVTDGYKGVHVDKFGNTFNDGLAFLAMINAYDPSFVDYNSIDPADIENNLNKAFELAETKMGIPKLLEASDLIEGNPDERSVILYVSLFFHAFVQAEEAKKKDEEREREKKEKMKKMTDLQSQLTEASERISEVIREKDDLLAQNENLQTQIADREKAIKDLEDRNHELLMELEELKKKRSSGRERGEKQIQELENKIDDISKQLAANDAAKAELEARNKALLAELEATKKANDEMMAKQDQIANEVKASQAKLDEEAKRRNRMKAEVEDLKKKVGKEVERRRQKSKALLELQKEVQALRKRALIEAKARRGLDVLKINLEEHLEDMFQWRDLHQLDTDGGRLEFNLEEVLTELTNKSFEDQIEVLNDRLQSENKNLTRIIKLKDTNHELKEIVEKEGWLYMKQKKSNPWTKAWFVLRGNNLFYFKDESLKAEIGKTSLAECQLVALKAEKVEDANIPIKKFFITKLTVEGQKEALYLGFGSLKEKSGWAVPLKSKVQNFNYLRAVEKTNSRPDNRILALFGARDLRSCYLDNAPIPMEGIEAITSVLSLHDLLDTISLVNANLGDNEIKLLSESLSKWKLKVLNVGNNKLTSAGAVSLLKALGSAANEYLTELHLNDNEIDDDALAVLAEVFPNLPKLKVLNLTGNRIGDSGVKVLCDALAKAPNAIPALSLSNNNISDAGASSIAALLKSTGTIVAVQLAGNEIADSGAETIAASLTDNISVDEVDFSLNRIGNKGALAFTKLLHANKTIQTLNLSGNKGIVGSEEILPLLNQHGFFFPSLIFTRVV